MSMATAGDCRARTSSSLLVTSLAGFLFLSRQDCSDPGCKFPNRSLNPFLCSASIHRPPALCLPGCRTFCCVPWAPPADAQPPLGHSCPCRNPLIALGCLGAYEGHCSPPGSRSVPPPFLSQRWGSLGAWLGGFCSSPPKLLTRQRGLDRAHGLMNVPLAESFL